jgi:hypothetical protein
VTRSSWVCLIAELAEQYGATVELTNGSHWRLRHPDGWFVIASQTPRDEWHARRYVERDIRKAIRGVLGRRPLNNSS